MGCGADIVEEGYKEIGLWTVSKVGEVLSCYSLACNIALVSKNNVVKKRPE